MGYYCKGKIQSRFTFLPGDGENFDGLQKNGRTFSLSPVKEDEETIGFVWSMPSEYPLFKVVFGNLIHGPVLGRMRELTLGRQMQKPREAVESSSSTQTMHRYSTYRTCNVTKDTG